MVCGRSGPSVGRWVGVVIEDGEGWLDGLGDREKVRVAGEVGPGQVRIIEMRLRHQDIKWWVR